MKLNEKVALVQPVQNKYMNTYNFLFTIDGVENNIEVNAEDNLEAWSIVDYIYPEADRIILVTN